MAASQRGVLMSIRLALITWLFLLSVPFPAHGSNEDLVELETIGIYRMGPGDSEETARKLALFQAKITAVETAAKYLSAKNVLYVHPSEKDEIYCLAAALLRPGTVQEQWKAVGDTRECLIRIRVGVGVPDFVRAEKEDRILEKRDSGESFLEEMEPVIPGTADPGLDLSEAYRLFQKKDWRRAIIYLDTLEHRYPHWGALYMAKAKAYYADGEPLEMKRALERACRLGNSEACHDLESLKSL
jgi:tetratricopeptide (TPR) repeat protein